MPIVSRAGRRVGGSPPVLCTLWNVSQAQPSIRDFLALQATSAGCTVEVEPTRLSDRNERPDLAIRGFTEGPHPEEAWDVTVSHPLRQSASSAARVTPEDFKSGNGVAAFCRRAGVSFRPLAWETTGAAGKEGSGRGEDAGEEDQSYDWGGTWRGGGEAVGGEGMRVRRLPARAVR